MQQVNLRAEVSPWVHQDLQVGLHELCYTKQKLPKQSKHIRRIVKKLAAKFRYAEEPLFQDWQKSHLSQLNDSWWDQAYWLPRFPECIWIDPLPKPHWLFWSSKRVDMIILMKMKLQALTNVLSMAIKYYSMSDRISLFVRPT